MEDTYFKIQYASLNLKHWQSIIAIAVIALVLFSRWLFTPALFGDDWYFTIRGPLEITLQCPSSDLRFLLECYYLLLYKLFGLNVIAHHVATFTVFLLCAIVFYYLMIQILPDHPLLALIIALLFLIFPTDNIRNFWIISGYMTVAYIFLLLSIISLLIFSRNDSWWYWIGSIIFLILSFGFYEAVVGLTIFASIIIFLFSTYRLSFRKFALLAPALIAFFYSILRWQKQIALGNTYGHTTESIELSLPILLSRFIHGYMISIYQGWTAYVKRTLSWILNDINHNVADVISVIILVFILTIIVLFLKFIFSFWKENSNYDFNDNPSLPPLKQLFIIGTIGLFAIGAGYIPMILAFWANLDYEASRINPLPSIGASILVGACLAIFAILLGFKGRQSQIALICLAIPFMFIGINTKIKVQSDTEIGWLHQRQIYQGIFTIAPNLAPETHVILVVGDYGDDHIGAFPFMGGAEFFEFGLNLFYGRSDLHGSYFQEGLVDIDFPSYSNEGISIEHGNSSHIDYAYVPYEKSLLLYFDSEREILHRIYDLPQSAITEIGTSPSLCPNCILDQPAQQTRMRWLVE